MKFSAAFFLIPFVMLLSGQKPRLRAGELLFATGKWKGSLTYIDYGTKKPYTMPANFDISIPAALPGHIIVFNEYPDEPKANNYDTLLISKGGRSFGGERILDKKIVERTMYLLTETNGSDDDRPATIRHRYTFGPHECIIYKEVRFSKQDSFMMRHEYRMSR